MGLDIQYMREELRNITGMDAEDLPDSKADVYLNRSYWELLDKYHFREKDVTITFVTVVGQDRYAVPTPFEAVQKIIITDPVTNKLIPLRRITLDTYATDHDLNTTARAQPTEYIREADFIRLEPIPDKIYTITLKYWTTLADLMGVNAVPPIPQSYHEIILFGGAWRTFAGNNDWVRVNEVKKTVKSLLDSAVPVEAKEERDSSRAGLQPIVREYDV